MAANMLAAVTSGIWWSMAAGMKCVAINPLVDAPQTKKLPARTQNCEVRDAWRSTRKAREIGLLPGSKAASSSSAP